MIRDSGLQAERTALAWSRTALAVLANALLCLRSGMVSGHTGVSILAVTLFLGAAAIAAYAALRRRTLLSDAPEIGPSHHAIALAALISIVTCTVGVWSVFAGGVKADQQLQRGAPNMTDVTKTSN